MPGSARGLLAPFTTSIALCSASEVWVAVAIVLACCKHKLRSTFCLEPDNNERAWPAIMLEATREDQET